MAQTVNPAIPKTINQARTESELLRRKGSVCPLNQVVKVSLDLESLQLNSLRDALENRFFDANLMQAVACLFDGIIYTPEGNPNFDTSQGLRHWLVLLKAIGSPSVNGVAMLGGLRNLDQSFILKVALVRPGEPAEFSLALTTHEYFVAAFGTNLLRSIDPGYSYVFSKFPCGGPGFTNKEVLTFCGSSQPREYLVYEKITGQSWADNLATWTPQQFFVAWLQLLNTLAIGNTQIGFSHNDLHGDNVLLRQIAVPISFKIDLGNIKGYVTTNTIPTLIDFGQSQIKYGGLYFGFYGIEKYGIVAGPVRPLVDVHKLLFWTLHKTLIIRRRDLFDQIRYLAGYFYPLDTVTDNFVVNMSDNFYSYTDAKLASRPISDYANWIAANMAKAVATVLTAEALTPTLNCQGLSCQADITAGLKTLGLDLAAPATNQLDLQDLAEAFTVARKDELYRIVLTREYQSNQQEYLRQVDDYFRNILLVQGQINTILGVSQGNNLAFAERLKRLAEISELLLKSSLLLRILISLKDLFNNADYNRNLELAVNIDANQRAVFKPYVDQVRNQVPALRQAAETDANLSKHLGEYLLTIGSLGY